jgi:hypothetical protein
MPADSPINTSQQRLAKNQECRNVLATLLQLLCSVVVFCQLPVPVCLVNHAAERRLSLRMMELLQQTHASTSSRLPSC